MDEPEVTDKDKIIAELKAENADLKEQQSIWFGTEEVQKKVKAIIFENKELKAEVSRLRTENTSLSDKLQNMRTPNQERIMMQAEIKCLQKEVASLKDQINNGTMLSEEDKKLLEWGRAMKKRQSGRQESKRIPNEFIKEKYLSGCIKPSIIRKALLEERKVDCSLKTVICRIDNMIKRGELPKLEEENPMSEKKDKLLFNISVIEQYRDNHKIEGSEVISLFKTNSIFDYLNEHYDTLHTMSIESVVNDIEEMLNRGQQ